MESNSISVSEDMEAESSLSLAERRPRREKRLPLRYRVDLPVQLPGLPPPFVAELVVSMSSIPILLFT